MTDRSTAQSPHSDPDAEALEWFAHYSDAPDAAYVFHRNRFVAAATPMPRATARCC